MTYIFQIVYGWTMVPTPITADFHEFKPRFLILKIFFFENISRLENLMIFRLSPFESNVLTPS